MISLEILYKLRKLKEEDPVKFSQAMRSMPRDAQMFVADHWYFNLTPSGELGTRMEQILPWHEPWTYTIWKPARRWGKSFAGSSNVADDMIQHEGMGWIGVGASFNDCKKVMIEGDSGVIAALIKRGYSEQDGVSRDTPAPGCFIYTSSGIPTVKLDNGSFISFYTAEKASKLRGQGVSRVWLDEVFTYFEEEDIEIRNHKLDRLWMQCMIVLSKAKDPRMLISSTPTPVALLKKLYKDMDERPDKYRYVVGRLIDNPWLSDEYKDEMVRELGNTRLGRQELYGEECWDVPGALWNWDMFKHITKKEFDSLEDITRVLVAIDPAATNNKNSDETGIVAAARSRAGNYYILEDASMKGSPREWATRAMNLAEKYRASAIVYETNQGGDMVAETLKTVNRTFPLKGVRASRGKYARAEPIASLYEKGSVYHIEGLNKLEAQLCEYNPDLYKGSPDRLDALVWALHELSARGEMKIYTW